MAVPRQYCNRRRRHGDEYADREDGTTRLLDKTGAPRHPRKTPRSRPNRLAPLRSTPRTLLRLAPLFLSLPPLSRTHALRLSPPTLADFGPGDVSLYVTSEGSARLLSASDLPPVPAAHRRLVAIGDTHGKHRFLRIPPCDVLCHCGDILQRYGPVGDLGGDLPVFLDFRAWLRSVPARAAVVVAGNHDLLLERLGDDAVRRLLRPSGAIYLRDGAATVAGLRVFGSPWSPAGGTGNAAFQSGKDAKRAAEEAGRSAGGDVDVLLTHAGCERWEAFGGKASFWAYGHRHGEQGTVRVLEGGCVSVNVACNDMIYRPRNPPVVFDVPLPNRNNGQTKKRSQ